MASPTVMTVLGPVPAEALGATMVHEHIFFQLGSYFRQADDDLDGAMASAPVAPARQWWLRANPISSRDNLIQDSLDVAVSEVAQFKAAGGGTLVDVTTVGIEPNPKGLAAVARQTGVNVVASTGYYVAASLPSWVAERSVEELADGMRRELLEGIAGTNIRAGLIGELGITNPPAPVEERVLAAAARVQRELGCPVSVHPSFGADGPKQAARLAEKVGLNPERTVLSHLDNRLRDDVASYRELAARGFRLALDCFGLDCYYPHWNVQLPSDADRIRALLGLLDAGLDSRIFLSQDICYKHALVWHGGHGYAHVLRTIRPRLLRCGVDQATLDSIVVDNPRAFLTGT